MPRLRALIGRDYVVYEGVTLPPRDLRLGGPSFTDDAAFLRSAQAEARRCVERLGLKGESRLLDVGCGMGRLAIGISSQVGEIRQYWGVDVNETYIRWCQGHIEKHHPSARFLRLDIQNPRYNPSGQGLPADFRFPFPEQSFDIVYLFSVFSHMLEADVRIYMQEFHRLLGPGGRLFFTAFAERGVPPVSVNPAGYRREWSGPLHCVRYEMGLLTSMVEEAGFTIDRLDYATEIDGQSAFYAARTNP